MGDRLHLPINRDGPPKLLSFKIRMDYASPFPGRTSNLRDYRGAVCRAKRKLSAAAGEMKSRNAYRRFLPTQRKTSPG